ncbi:energy transducer TonB [Chitinophaga qingshengii]|uniref:Energy transducer TonB n=1 Tax=Chitinophaga qingshengii TaxID=1569794 RepID=A0ABR7TVP0_9BACT|nr:energy transducer TonB [Chitinophaga qingshengii]MBC9933658.1 energy transducer TonB [Chitinophaga qingshengii]
MPDKHAHNKPTVSAELIRQYLAGELDDKAMHALERQALDDPFLADALEGYAMHAPDQQAHQEDLMARLTARVAPRKAVVRPLYTRMAAAAAILLLLFTGGWFLIREQHRQQEPIAQSVTPPPAALQDTPATPAAPVLAEMSETNSQKAAPVPPKSFAPPAAAARAMNEPAADMSAKDEKAVQKPAAEKVIKEEPAPATVHAPAPAAVPPPAAAPVSAAPPMGDVALSQQASAERRMKIAGASEPDSSSLANSRGALNEVMVTGYSRSRKKARAIVVKDSLPSPVGGSVAYKAYLEEHTANPGGLNGLVRIVFTVMPDGTLQQFKVIKSLAAVCDAEAIRVIKDGPAWKPAADGKPAEATVDVIFREKIAE